MVDDLHVSDISLVLPFLFEYHGYLLKAKGKYPLSPEEVGQWCQLPRKLVPAWHDGTMARAQTPTWS